MNVPGVDGFDLDDELTVIADPAATDAELLSLRFPAVTTYEALTVRPGLSPLVQLHLASRVTGSLMVYTPTDAPPSRRCARAFYATATDPTAVEVAAASLAIASNVSSGVYDLPGVARILLASPACTPRARVAAVWSVLVPNGFYVEHFSAQVDEYLEVLGAGCPEARLAAILGRSVVSLSGKNHGLDLRCPVGLFTRKVFALAADLASPEALEAYVALHSEWEGSDAALASTVSVLV